MTWRTTCKQVNVFKAHHRDGIRVYLWEEKEEKGSDGGDDAGQGCSSVDRVYVTHAGSAAGFPDTAEKDERKRHTRKLSALRR